MSRAVIYLSLALAAACGGSGGAATAGTPTRLSSGSVEFGPSANTADLVVALTNLPSPAPVLLQIAVVLPAALTIAPTDPLEAIQPVTTLRGEQSGNRYVVVYGDDRNPAGLPLQDGALFRLRLMTTTPRQVGTHSIRLEELIVAQGDGTPAVTNGSPTTVAAVVQ